MCVCANFFLKEYMCKLNIKNWLMHRLNNNKKPFIIIIINLSLLSMVVAFKTISDLDWYLGHINNFVWYTKMRKHINIFYNSRVVICILTPASI